MPDEQPPSTTSVPDLLTLATLAPVARQSVVDAVADRLRNEILSGRLRPGTRLPSERELSLALGVNRLTLRASLARLEALGLITTRHGAGTIVASWRERAGLEMLGTLVKGLKLADPAWHELVRSALELRRILAAEAAALAAERHGLGREDAADLERAPHELVPRRVRELQPLHERPEHLEPGALLPRGDHVAGAVAGRDETQRLQARQ